MHRQSWRRTAGGVCCLRRGVLVIADWHCPPASRDAFSPSSAQVWTCRACAEGTARVSRADVPRNDQQPTTCSSLPLCSTPRRNRRSSRLGPPRKGAPDQELLAWAADVDRVLVSHDASTMTGAAYTRIERDAARTRTASGLGVASCWRAAAAHAAAVDWSNGPDWNVRLPPNSLAPRNTRSKTGGSN